MSWSSTHVLFLDQWATLCGGVYPTSIFVGAACRVPTHAETSQTTSTNAMINGYKKKHHNFCNLPSFQCHFRALNVLKIELPLCTRIVILISV